MSEHWCKTVEPYYSDVEKGIKPFEVRIDDRFPAYAVGDTLHLQQFTGGKLTGRECARTVTYALRDPAYVKDGYVVLGIMPLEDASPSAARDLSLEELENKKQELEGKIAAYDHYIRRQGNLPDCNTCGIRKECAYVPGLGEYVRVNCPLWQEG